MTTRVAGRALPGTASGLPGVGELEWGSHVCQFYTGRQDLLDTLVPWFRAGLENGERCVWIAAEPLRAEAARAALRKAVPGLDRLEALGQIEILDHDRWYLAREGLVADEVLDSWIRREEAALRDGWTGLRVNGNVSFLGPDDRRAFEAYEQRVNRAFHERRIVALCSYPLSDCRSEELLEVLRNHDRALVSRDGVVRTIHGATLLLSEVDGGTRPSRATPHPARGHSVHFYDGVLDTGPIVRFLGPALDEGEAVVLIATAEHRRRILEELRARGLDVASLLAGGTIVELDAHDALARVAPAGSPSDGALRGLVDDVFEKLAARHGAIAAYGEVVDLMARQELIGSATELERIWNGVMEAHPVRLLCGYDLAAFDHDHEGVALGRICAEHAELVDDVAGAARDADHLRVVLRQRTRLAREATRQVARLQNITAALAEAATLERVERVVSGTVAHALGADDAVLRVFPTGHAGNGNHPGPSAVALPGELAPLVTRLDGRQAWIATRRGLEERLGEDAPPSVGALASLPLTVGGVPLGTVTFTFGEERTFTLADRALFEDVARQVSIAVDRARLYRQAERAREDAVSANRTKDEFLAMLGHELRNPLAPIMNALQVMELRGDERTAHERTVVSRQVSHLHRLVEDLLDISRITHGKISIEAEPVELGRVVERAVETTAPARAQRRHELVMDVPETGLVVDADSDRLTQVVANLLDNAAKFTPPGGTIHVTARADDGEVLLRVRDSGVGMAPELATSVFDSFVQGTRSTDVRGGLGVGLAIVRGLVEAHGGSVEASSSGPDRGCEFVVRLPRSDASELRDHGAALFQANGARPSAGRGVRVLIVDDNVDAATALGDLVELFGGEPRLAHDGPTALAEAASFRPGLVLLDIGLPGMSGHDVASRMRELPASEDCRIVAVTGFGQEADRARSLEAGCDEHWVKPLSPRMLEALVEELSKRRAGPAREAS